MHASHLMPSPVHPGRIWEAVQAEYLGLSLDGHDYAVELSLVQALRPQQGAGPGMGLLDEHPTPYLPVVDLHGLDGEPGLRAAGGVLVILETGRGRLALLVDRVGEVLSPEPEICPPEAAQRARGRLMRGPRGLRRVRLIDAEALQDHLGPHAASPRRG